MNNVDILTNNKNIYFKEFNSSYGDSHYKENSFIKQQIHEKHIDEFFHVDINAPPKRHSNLALIGSLTGVLSSTVFFAKKQNPNLKFSNIKNIAKVFDIKYGLKEILTVGLGGIVGGLSGGLADKKEKDKLKKIEEAVFQSMNISFPAILVDSSIKMCNKSKRLNNAAAKVFFTIASVLTGVHLAVNAANKIDGIFFDKYHSDAERVFKKKDLIIHIDDLFSSLVLAKLPFAEKLHINKILPLIFGWCGYHAGDC